MIKNLIITGLLFSFLLSNTIDTIVDIYDSGFPREIHLFEDYNNKLRLQEKRFYYQNGNIKAIEYFSGFKSGNIIYYDETTFTDHPSICSFTIGK